MEIILDLQVRILLDNPVTFSAQQDSSTVVCYIHSNTYCI